MTGPRTQRSRAIWLARQYYFQMLADALDQYVEDPDLSKRDNAAESLIYAMRLVGAAIEADEPKEPPTCPDKSPSPPKPLTPEDTAGASSTSEDSEVSAADLTLTFATRRKDWLTSN